MDYTATETVEVTVFDRSFMLVGKYLSAWGHMESQINQAIWQGLGLSSLQGAIVCVNAGFTAKCHILQTLSSLGKVKKKGTKDDNEKLFEKIKNLSTDRNMIAHNRFFPDKTKKGEFCVDFTMILAKGNFDLPKVKWTEKHFNNKIEELYQLADKIKEIGKTLSFRKLAAALMKDSNPPPMFGLLGRGLLNLPTHPPQVGGLLGNLFFSSETNFQSPQKPDE